MKKHTGCRAVVVVKGGKTWRYCSSAPKYTDAIGRKWCRTHLPSEKTMIRWEMAVELQQQMEELS